MALSTNEPLQLTKLPRDGQLMKRRSQTMALVAPVYGWRSRGTWRQQSNSLADFAAQFPNKGTPHLPRSHTTLARHFGLGNARAALTGKSRTPQIADFLRHAGAMSTFALAQPQLACTVCRICAEHRGGRAHPAEKPRRRVEAVLLAVRRRRASACRLLPGGRRATRFRHPRRHLRRVGSRCREEARRLGLARPLSRRFRATLVLLLEFQSTVDADMARRVLRNIGMAAERLRRNRALDPDGRLRALCIVIHSGRNRWTAPGAATRVVVDDDGEVLALVALPYAALDARRIPREHLPARNLVSTLLQLNRTSRVADAVPPLQHLSGWLGELGTHAEPVRAAYAEWLVTTMPTLLSPEQATTMVERFAGTGKQEAKEEGMVVYTVLEDKIRRQLRHAERKGLAQAMEHERKLLRGMAARRFGPETAARLAPLLAEVRDNEGLEQVGEWIVDCADGEELIAQFGNGALHGS